MDEVADRLKAAMRRLPGPVALITTVDPEDSQPAGLAASSVISVSFDPASMLFAVNKTSNSLPILDRAGRYCINLLCNTQADLVGLFSNPALRAERFAGDVWAYRDGIPYLPGACTNIFCTTAAVQPFGTHHLFIAQVEDVLAGTGTDPMAWIEGGFAQMVPVKR